MDLQTSATQCEHKLPSVFTIGPAAKPSMHKQTLHCDNLFSISACVFAQNTLTHTIRATLFECIHDGDQPTPRKKSSKYPTHHSVTDDEITNKEKQILIDIGQIFITVVKCLDVFTQKLSISIRADVDISFRERRWTFFFFFNRRSE